MNFNLDILPADLAANRFTHWLPRLKADGVEIHLRDEPITVDEGENDIGKTFTVSLLKTTDKSAFTDAASIDFGIGRKIAGVWDESTFNTLLSGAKVKTIQDTIEGPPHDPKDRVSVTIISADAEKLNATSEKGTILYDPNKVTISADDFETIYDKDGQAYSPEVVAVAGLDLAYLFNYVFVTKCGFTSYRADDFPLSDYPIEQFRVGMGSRFYDSLKSFISMYKYAARVENNVIYLNDVTIEHPANFPAPKEITLDLVANQLNLSQEKQKLDALMLHFVGLENNYDYTAPRIESGTSQQGNSQIDFERIFIEFRKITSPTSYVVVRDPLNIENETVTINGVESEESSNVYEFDSSYEYSNRRKTVHSRLPDLPSSTPAILEAREELERFAYQVHPFRPRSKYLARREEVVHGLITVDEDNPNVYGDPAKQAAVIAHRSNNTAEGQSYEYDVLSTHVESAEPLRDGTVRVRVKETDEVTGTVPVNKTEVRPGEIGTNGFATTEQVMPVFAVDNATRSLKRIDDFYIGPLPLKYGLPLAKRELVNRQSKNQNVTLPVIGYDASLQKGFAIAPKDRDGVSLGNFLIIGVSINISRQGLLMNLTCREIADTAASIQDVPAVSNSIDAGAQETFTIPVDCAADTILTLSPRTVPNLTIEARRVGDIAWIDLSSFDVDLSPWDGTTQDFEIRITAGSVATLTHTHFEIAVDQA